MARYQALSFFRVVLVEFGYGLLHLFEGPADGLTDFTKNEVLIADGGRGRLGIFEPREGFGGGGFFSGGGALGGVGVLERVMHLRRLLHRVHRGRFGDDLIGEPAAANISMKPQAFGQRIQAS
ncbi:MAG: hypothetical protein JST28_09290 [Acidobacteria bacterium]|nr:hypothetical protein [Acidobacteriota bacterium]